MKTFTVPLHTLCIDSHFVTGEVTVPVQSELPISGVHMLLGNDLAGVKVFPDPIVIEQPDMKIDVDGEEENKQIFPQCSSSKSLFIQGYSNQ